MEIKKATIKRTTSAASLVLEVVSGKPQEIVLTDDNPNNVKSVFNGILKQLKKGAFQFELKDDKDDLYKNICTEYIAQLNKEIKTVFNEIQEFGLADAK